MNTERLLPHRRDRAATPPPVTWRKLVLALGASGLLLSGCANSPFFQQRQARSAAHPKATTVLERDSAPAREAVRSHGCDRDCALQKESADLREGIRLYNDGDFDGAIKRLSARELNNAPLSTRLTALKYAAFSYCVSSRPAQCRQSFEKALRLDPGLELAPGEQGHPLWGPEFIRARQAARAR